MNKLKNKKIAIVCDWLTNFAGAETIILKLHQMFPDAPIYTSTYNAKEMDPYFKNAKIITSYLQNIPFANTKHQLFLKWYPAAFESFDLSEYDIVISSNHSCSKGIITKPDTVHISYCHSPMRYVWDDWQNYIKSYNLPTFIKKMAYPALHDLRIWDRLAADRVDHFISNSEFIGGKINKYYRRDSEVIYPFINVDDYYTTSAPKKYYLAVGRFTPYKKFDLVVDAFNKLGLPVKIVGRGVQEQDLKKKAKSNVEFTGFVSRKQLKDLFANAKALIFPQIEDFGIIPLESMASGRPVIAFKGGGALETVKEGVSGVFFDEQTTDSLVDAVKSFEKDQKQYKSNEIRKYSMKFDESEFEKRMLAFIDKVL